MVLMSGWIAADSLDQDAAAPRAKPRMNASPVAPSTAMYGAKA